MTVITQTLSPVDTSHVSADYPLTNPAPSYLPVGRPTEEEEDEMVADTSSDGAASGSAVSTPSAYSPQAGQHSVELALCADFIVACTARGW